MPSSATAASLNPTQFLETKMARQRNKRKRRITQRRKDAKNLIQPSPLHEQMLGDPALRLASFASLRLCVMISCIRRLKRTSYRPSQLSGRRIDGQIGDHVARGGFDGLFPLRRLETGRVFGSLDGEYDSPRTVDDRP
jgi:hypothetical protein